MDRSSKNNHSDGETIVLLREENAWLQQRVSLLEKHLAAANKNNTNAKLHHQPDVAALETSKPQIPNGIWMDNIVPFMDQGYALFITPAPSSKHGVAFEYHSIPFTKEYIASLVKDGNLSLLKEIYKIDSAILDMDFELPGCRLYNINWDRTWRDRVSFTAYASFNGHLDIVKWLIDLEKVCVADCGAYASGGGHIHILEWIFDHTLLVYGELAGLPDACLKAAMQQDVIEVLQFLHDRCSASFGIEEFKFAAAYRIFGVLQWLVDMDCDGTEDAWYTAAECGHLEVLELLRNNNCPTDDRACDAAAKYGRLEVIQWLCEKGYPRNEEAFASAAEHGHIHVLEWLYANDFPRNERTAFFLAAGHFHVHVLDWLHAHHCDCGDLFKVAAGNGQLRVLQWLRANGYPWDVEVFAEAARSGPLEVLEWLRDNGCPWDEQACVEAARSRRMQVLGWLRDNGCPWNPALIFSQAGDNSSLLPYWFRFYGPS